MSTLTLHRLPRPLGRWSTVRYEARQAGVVVGEVWDWRPGRGGPRRWAAQAVDVHGQPLASTKGRDVRSQLEARAWLAGYWLRRGAVVPVGAGEPGTRSPAPR